MPFKIKYGDTDSIFVAIPGVTNQQLCVLCEDLAERINDLLPKTFKPDGSGELAGLIIEFEKWYDRLLLYKKKKYIGAKMEPDAVKPKLDMTGISAVRRDNFPIQVKTVSTVLNILMEPGPSIEVRSDRFRVSDGVVVLGRWASRQYLRDRVCALSDVCVDSVLFQVDETVPYAWATLEGSSTEIALERAKGKISDLIVDTVTKMYAGEFLVDQYAVSKSIKSPHLYANRDGMPHLHVMRRAIRDHPDYAPMVSHRHPFVFVTELCNAEMAKGRRQNNIPKGAYLESAPIAALTGKKPRLEHYTEYLSNNIAKVIFPLFTRTSENLKVRASGGLRARDNFRRFASARPLPAVCERALTSGESRTGKDGVRSRKNDGDGPRGDARAKLSRGADPPGCSARSEPAGGDASRKNVRRETQNHSPRHFDAPRLRSRVRHVQGVLHARARRGHRRRRESAARVSQHRLLDLVRAYGFRTRIVSEEKVIV